MSLRDLLTPVCQVLQEEGIGYAIIGAFAVAAWGNVRGTGDIDILCEARDLEKLKTALRRAGLSFEHRKGDPGDPVQHVIRIHVPAGQGIDEIEIVAGIADAPKDIIARARSAKVDDLTLQVAGPEDMMILKLLAGSPIDVQDALGILRSKRRLLDFKLLHDICPERLQDALQELIARPERV